MAFKPNQTSNQFGKLIKSAIDANRKCGYPNCENQAIASHLLQKNGILNRIAERNHFYQLEANFFAGGTKFKGFGIHQGFTFKGFCQKHDSSIFAPIETSLYEISDYRTQILFSLRAILNEYRKKEILIEGFSKVLTSKPLEGKIDKQYIKAFIENNDLGKRDLYHFLKLLINDLESQKSTNFESYYIEIDKLPICISATFSVDSDLELMTKRLVTPSKWFNDHLQPVIINLFPKDESSQLLVTYPKRDSSSIKNYIDKYIKPIKDDKSYKLLSDLIINNFETWACSNSFYIKNIKQREESILKYISNDNKPAPPIPLNIFA